MVIHVELHFFPDYCGGQKNVTLELAEDADVRAMLLKLGIPAGEAGVILMNKKHAALADKLEAFAHMDVYPMVTGG